MVELGLIEIEWTIGRAGPRCVGDIGVGRRISWLSDRLDCSSWFGGKRWWTWIDHLFGWIRLAKRRLRSASGWHGVDSFDTVVGYPFAPGCSVPKTILVPTKWIAMPLGFKGLIRSHGQFLWALGRRSGKVFS